MKRIRITWFNLSLFLMVIGLLFIIEAIHLKFGTFNIFLDCLFDSRLAKNMRPNPDHVKIFFTGIIFEGIGLIIGFKAMVKNRILLNLPF